MEPGVFGDPGRVACAAGAGREEEVSDYDFSNFARVMAERDRFKAALQEIHSPIPSTKGMNPKDRALRLHSVLSARITIAREALAMPSETDAFLIPSGIDDAA
jgi:hypothetical protein